MIENRKTLIQRMILSFAAAAAFGVAAIFSYRQGMTRVFMLAPALLWLVVGLMLRRKAKAASAA